MPGDRHAEKPIAKKLSFLFTVEMVFDRELVRWLKDQDTKEGMDHPDHPYAQCFFHIFFLLIFCDPLLQSNATVSAKIFLFLSLSCL